MLQFSLTLLSLLMGYCLSLDFDLSVFFCAPEKKMTLLRKIQPAGRLPCEARPSGGQPQPCFSSKMQTGAPCKGTAQGWGHGRGSFLHRVVFLRDAHTAMEVLTFPSSAGPDILSSGASCKRHKCIPFSLPLGKLSHHIQRRK